MFEQLFRKTGTFFSLVVTMVPEAKYFFHYVGTIVLASKKKLFRVKQMFHPKTIQMYLSEVLS